MSIKQNGLIRSDRMSMENNIKQMDTNQLTHSSYFIDQIICSFIIFFPKIATQAERRRTNEEKSNFRMWLKS